jgi:hypothetical protein
MLSFLSLYKEFYMECSRFEHYLSENEGVKIAKNSDLYKHAAACPDCRSFLLFNKIMYSQKEVFEKAPETILSGVRQRIRERQNLREQKAWLNIFKPLLKPAIGFSVILIALVFYMHLKNGHIGVVNNLEDRFNRTEFKNIKVGDILYASKHIHVDLTLTNHAKLHLDSNTLLQFRARDKITLSRGQIYLTAGGNEMKIETPNGLIIVKNGKTKIGSDRKKEKGAFITKTSCSAIEGIVKIGHSREQTVVSPGQEIILAGNGKIVRKDVLPDSAMSEQTSRINSASPGKVFTAKEQLCECLYDSQYNSDDKTFHGKETKENKFPVRVFWRNKDKFESMRRTDESICFFNADGGSIRAIGSGPGI